MRRAKTQQWMYAALNSVEPHVQNLAIIDFLYANEDWGKARRPGAEKLALSRLAGVAASLAGRQYLVDQFSAADLLMVTVLRLLMHTRLVADDPVLSAYRARCEARPAFQRALAAQLAPFAKYAPAAA